MITLLVLGIGVIVSIVYWSWRNGISPMPSTARAKECLLVALPKDVNGVIYELGCGWGTLLFPLAREFPNSKVIGYETSPIPYLVCKLLKTFYRLPNVELVRRDFFSMPLGDASLIVCYLYPGAMRKLKEKLSNELKSGTLVATNTFAIPGWTPENVIEIGDMYHTKIYLYKKL